MVRKEAIDIEGLRRHIPSLRDASLTLLEKGYSSDRKYEVRMSGGDRQLLRLFAADGMERRHAEFESLRVMKGLGVQCPEPLELGTVPGTEIGYMRLGYIEGEDASERLPLLSDADQYRIGEEAGVQLHRMNQNVAPAGHPDWYAAKLAKHSRYVERYRACGVRIRKDDSLLDFIERNVCRMRHRPNRFQHDDFHPANLIVRDNRLAGVIDFGRFDWGDPVHEFLKTGLFASEISVPFSKGNILGYHQGREPDDEFWGLYALYIAMSLISSVVWTLQTTPDEMPQMMNKIERVLDDHEDFQQLRPKWYTACPL